MTSDAASRVIIAAVETAPLDLAAHLDAVSWPAAGAIATFVGRVRDHDPEAAGEVVALEYSSHPSAPDVIAEIAERIAAVAEAAGEDCRIAVSHRVGHLEVGGDAIIAAVATAHRALAFDLCRDLVETVKAELPIWKKQVEADGSHGWVGLGRLAD